MLYSVRALNSSIPILLIRLITKTLSFITVACYHNMWNRKLHDEMFYGVILFRYFSFLSVFRDRGKEKMEIDLWDKRVNTIQRSHENSASYFLTLTHSYEFHLFRLYLHKSCWKAEIVTNSETFRFPLDLLRLRPKILI